MTLEQWVRAQLGADQGDQLRPLTGDAGFRSYYRFGTGANAHVVMDAGRDRASCGPFVRVARLLAGAGLNVPNVVAADLERGWLLLSDLGDQTYLQSLRPLAASGGTASAMAVAGRERTADDLFDDAIDALLRLQAIPCPDDLPRYDAELLRRELELFPEWYLQRHHGIAVPPALRGLLDRTFELLVERALGQGRVLVHRDFMPRNLMVSEPGPGVLDFQDAVCGPVSYDPVCLFQDAFISWPPARVERWLRHYWERARARALPVPADWQTFRTDCDLMGAQRHLKVIGIFARICHRDGKPHYLQDVPRFVRYLREAAARQPLLAPLGELVDTVWPEAGA